MEEQPSIDRRIARSVGSGMKTGISTAVFLIKIMVPVSLAVALLDWSGLLHYIARFLAPGMRLIGLPGEAALALVSGFLLTNYSSIAVITVLGLPLREASIVAIVCLTAHNLILETAVMRKAGSSGLKMVLLRIGMGLTAGWVFNLLLPGAPAPASFTPPPHALAVWSTLAPALVVWGQGTARLILKIIILVVVILVTQRLLEEFHAAGFLARLAAPFMKVFGLPDSASLLWLVINLVGYTYGAAVIMEQIEGGKIKRKEADLFNHHAAVSHSLLEDTILYAALGIPIFWLTVPRLVMAILVVWAERLRRTAFRRSFRVGTV